MKLLKLFNGNLNNENMTLILTALCKNGICVCADKRNRTWSGGTKVNIDNLNKIFRFKNSPIIMFNHGVNKFNGKFWDVYCSEYEKTNRWKGEILKDIAIDFKDFIEPDLLKQLAQNSRNFPNNPSVTTSAFVICGKNSQSGKFEFFELFWSPTYSFGSWDDTKLICSGEGYKKYLEKYVNSHPQSNTPDYWGSLNTAQAIEELKKLFSIALNEQKAANGDDFSDNYDVESISD